MAVERRVGWESVRDDVLVAPSLLSADFSALGAEIERIESAGARLLHLDVMDGHFVPNITFGPPLVAAVRRRTGAFLDVHLMVEDPLRWIDPFAKAGSDLLTLHIEAGPELERCREAADARGVRLGLAIRPDSEIGPSLAAWGRFFDLILVMTVMPGFGGQEYMPGSAERIREAAGYCGQAARRPVLEVDGGIQPGTAAEAARAGARWFVAGSAIFRQPDPAAAYRTIEQEVRDAAAGQGT